MVRNFGRGIVLALLFAAGCEDKSMDLLPPPPAAAAGSAGSTMAGMAGHTPVGDGGWGGSGGSGMGGFGAAAGGYACPPGTPYPTRCCRSEDDCAGTPVPYCSYGRCVECVSAHDSDPQLGCETGDYCYEDFNGTSYCVPECTADDCAKRDPNHPICDLERNMCVQCTSDEHCMNTPGRRKHCQTTVGVCVECTSNDQCSDNARPICGMSSGVWYQCIECTSSSDCQDPVRKICSTSDPSDPLHNQCVECTRDKDSACKVKGQICNDNSGRCVDCVMSGDCNDPTTPICHADGRCNPCISSDECGFDGPCEDGRCVGRQDPSPQP